MNKILLALLGFAVTGASAFAEGTTAVDLGSVTSGATSAISAGASAGVPIFGGLVAIGVTVMAFRKIAHS